VTFSVDSGLIGGGFSDERSYPTSFVSLF
jgi:hypothetical protein